jgi:hypothetical protein
MVGARARHRGLQLYGGSAIAGLMPIIVVREVIRIALVALGVCLRAFVDSVGSAGQIIMYDPKLSAFSMNVEQAASVAVMSELYPHQADVIRHQHIWQFNKIQTAHHLHRGVYVSLKTKRR